MKLGGRYNQPGSDLEIVLSHEMMMAPHGRKRNVRLFFAALWLAFAGLGCEPVAEKKVEPFTQVPPPDASTDTSAPAARDVGGEDGGITEPVDVGPFPSVPGLCTRNSECVVAPKRCCPPCGVWGVDDVIAMALVDNIDYYRTLGCNRQEDCRRCPAVSFTSPEGNLQATCNAGHCELLVVSQSEVSACTEDSDCVLRWGMCCPPLGVSGRWNFWAIHRDQEAAYQGLLCDDVPPQCMATNPPSFPDGISARCVSGHCAPHGGGE